MWIALALGLPALVVAVAPMSAVDLAYGVREGQLIIGGAGIPGADTFTFTAAGVRWVDQQWLAQVIFAGAFGLGGWTALQVFWLGVVAATVALAARAAYVLGAGLRMSVLVALAGMLVAAQGLGLRAQVLGLLCLAVLLLLAAGRRDRPAQLWFAVPLFAAWANLHGSFVVGLVLLAATVLDDRGVPSARRRDLAVLTCASLATLANPYGIDAWRYVLAIGTDPTIATFVTEWRHSDALQPAGGLFYATLLLAAIILAAAAVRRRRLDLGSLVWVGVLAALGAWAVRAVAWWGIGAVPAVAMAASSLRRLGEPTVGQIAYRPSRLMAPSVAALAAAATLAIAIPTESRLTDAPRQIADSLRPLAVSRPGLRVFNAQRWGSWLELQVPGGQYFADSRVELIPASAWSNYLSIANAETDWEALLDRWQVEALALSSEDQPGLVSAVDGADGWLVVHRDADGLVAVRG